MRITGRQLRRIIQEEVARMVNEEDGSIVGATGTQAVKPMAVTGAQAPGTLPGGIKPVSIATNIARRLAHAIYRDDVGEEFDFTLRGGSTIEIAAKVVDVSTADPTAANRMIAQFTGTPEPAQHQGEFPISPVVDITSVTVDGAPYTGKEIQPGGHLRSRSKGTLSPDMQLTVTVSFKLPADFLNSITVMQRAGDRTMKGDAYQIMSKMFIPLIQAGMKVT